MKKSVFLFLAVTSLGVSAQKIVVKEGSQKFTTGSQNALSTTIYGSSKDDVQSKWKSVLKNYKNEKIKSEKNEMFGDNIVISDFGNNPVDIYTTFEENKKDKTVEMHVAIDLGGAYLTSAEQKEKYAAAEKIVKDFAINTTKDVIGEQVKDAEKALGKLEDDQKDLEKANKNSKDDIANYKDKITKAQTDLVTANAEVVKKKAEIDIQKKVVDASAGAVNEQAKSSQKIYDKLLDQEKDLQKDIKNLNSDIESYNSKIKNAEDDIKKNESNQDQKKKEIDAQKKVVENYKNLMSKVD